MDNKKSIIGKVSLSTHTSNYYRGHHITPIRNGWLYTDSYTPVSDDPDRPCGYCDKSNTPEGYDGCIGHIDGAMNACCGHGDIETAYVQYHDGICVRGEDAISIMRHIHVNNGL